MHLPDVIAGKPDVRLAAQVPGLPESHG